jgi:putative peptide zinc metalloprotease protein
MAATTQLPAPLRTAISRAAAPRLADGIELIGKYQGSGFLEPKYLARRGDGQMVQLTPLLYHIASRLDGQLNPAQLAESLRDELGLGLTAGQVGYLIDAKLRPAGLVGTDSAGDAAAATAAPAKTRSDPLLALRYRVAVIPARVAWAIGAVFRPFFWPPVMAALLTEFVCLDVLIGLRGGPARIAPSAAALVYHPSMTLLVLGLVVVAAGFHECGHVTACRYGGARPGVMGVGLYLVWPAFYSTVTDAYRLGRGGRLRTDLGGVYFNAVFIAGMSTAYLATRLPWLLVFIVLWHIETAWQFLPSVRLDGYYILADLVGVPDLFSRMGPVLRSAIPGRGPNPRVQEMRLWVRRVVSLWVALVLGCLLFYLGGFILLAHRLLPAEWHSLFRLAHAVHAAASAGYPARAALGAVEVILLLLPWAGVTLIIMSVAARLARARRLARLRWLTARLPGLARHCVRRRAAALAARLRARSPHPGPGVSAADYARADRLPGKDAENPPPIVTLNPLDGHLL